MSLTKDNNKEFHWIESLEEVKELLLLSPHVSTLLILQVIHSLSLQYFDNIESNQLKRVAFPFIHRFHGVLLFVDISGFTALSQRMTVESLQKHINNYFTKIINIIHKYDGEVVKFAGDALYVIWKTAILDPCNFLNRSLDDKNNDNIQLNVEKAIHCALHINQECNRFEITVESSLQTSQTHHNYKNNLTNINEEKSSRYLFKHSSLLSEEDEFRHDVEVSKEEKFFLSGLSAGVMAGVDVTSCERSEFFIVGKPLFEVANAEKLATKGELVVDRSIYQLSETLVRFVFENTTDPDFYRVAFANNNNKNNENNSFPMKELTVVFVDEEEQKRILLREVVDTVCFEYDSRVKGLPEEVQVSKNLFITTILSSLLHSVRCHVHDAVRLPVDRSEGSSANNSIRSSKTYHSSFMENIVSSVDNVTLTTVNSINDDLLVPSVQRNSISVTNLFKAELRSVVVLFIKLDVESSMTELSIDETSAERSFDGYSIGSTSSSIFLPRSAVELESDLELLNLLQSSYCCIAETLRQHHGQVRQFILDDKGSICIGSFGLKGSSAKNDSESAVTASVTIIDSLTKQSEIDSSIGITIGRTYCGLVGSPSRYEYSIMGSSVNLSARLMSLAESCTIMCDKVTRRKDSLHHFSEAKEITAKGYTDTITTFSISVDQEEEILLRPVGSPRSINGRRPQSGRLSSSSERTFSIHQHYISVTEEIVQFLCIDNNEGVHDQCQEESFPMKLVMIEGSTGIGKSHYLSYLSQELLKLSKSQNQVTKKIGFEIFSSKGVSIDVSSPFQIWRPIILSMLKNPVKPSNTVETVRKLRRTRSSQCSDNTSGKDFDFDINDEIIGELSIDLQQYMSLLNSIIFHTDVFDSNEKVDKLAANYRMDFSIKLLFNIIQLYINKNPKNVIIFLDNFELVDSYSFSLITLLWQNCLNVVIISSLNSDLIRENKISAEVSDKITSVVLVTENLKIFNEKNRFIQMKQPIMAKQDIISLTQYLLNDTVKLNSNICKFASNYVADICDNNPLYATELTAVISSAIIKFTEELNKSKEICSNIELDNKIKSLIHTIKSDRIGDSITKKIDYVSYESQLVLKAGATAGYNGYLFSVSLIASLLPDLLSSDSRDQWAISFNILKIIENLCDKNYFVFHGNNSDLTLTMHQKEDGYETDIIPSQFNNEYGFSSNGLRNYVYEMMLEDQKKYFHEKCAIFLKKQYITNSLVSPSHFKQISCHWEQAGNWMKAISFYYNAGVLFDKIGAFVESYNCLALSYSMLTKMKVKCHFGSTDEKSSLPDMIDKYYSLKTTNLKETDGPTNHYSISDLFLNDIENLQTAIKMISKYAQSVQSITLKSGIAPELLLEALHYICLTSGSLDNTGKDNSFRIKDASIIFPVLSGIGMILRNKRIPDDIDNSNEKRLCCLFIALAEEYNETVHIIQANSVSIPFCLKKNLFSDFEKHLDKIRDLYDFDSHSQNIIDAYGSDWALFRFASSTLPLLLYGKFRKSEYYSQLSHSYLDRIVHLNTTVTILYALTSLNIYLGNYSIAENYVEKLNSITSHYIFKPTVPFLYSLVKTLCNPKSEETSHKIMSIGNSNLLNILNNNNNNNKDNTRASYLNIIEYAFGRSLEGLQAELCLLKLIHWSSEDQEMYNNYLDAGLKYVESFLSLPHANGFEVILPYTNCLFIKVQLIMIDKRLLFDQRVDQSLLILKDLITLSEKTNILFVKLLAGYYLIKLNINIIEGKQTLDQFINNQDESSEEMIRDLNSSVLYKDIKDIYNNSIIL